MFLIEFEKGGYINGEEVNWVGMKKDSITFTIKGDTESLFTVGSEFQPSFVNNLQAINDNGGFESRFYEINNEKG